MDLQVIQFNDTLKVIGAEEIPDMLPRSLKITGPDFRSAVEVFINEQSSPSFVVASKAVIISQVPEEQKDSVIESISVISSDFTVMESSRVRFRIGINSKSSSGLKQLLQIFLKVLLATSGSDAFAQGIGGNGLQGIGKNFGISESQSIISDFAIAVRRAESQIKSLQSRQPRISDDERLLSANILNSRFDVSLTTLVVRVELISQSGKRAITNLEL